MISLQFVRGGRAIFTVSNASGKHYTFRVKASKPSEKYPKVSHFVQMLTGPDNTSDYTYVGMLTDEDTVRLTAKSKYNADSEPVKVFNWALRVIGGKAGLPAGYNIQHEGRCCRCGRVLTVPQSIESGIGPECAQKMAG
jgi:hypothetical protein